MDKRDFLREPVQHIDIKTFDATPIIDGLRGMSFTARDTARATDILNRMLEDRDCTILLCLAGSTSAAGCMQIYIDMVRHNMVDAVVATGATIVDMDFFEALGFRHYRGTPISDDKRLRELYIDRIYDTYIDEEQLQVCDNAVQEIADGLERRPYSSREFIREMGKYLKTNVKKEDSLVLAAYERDVPVFCPAFSDSSAGFGLVKHQVQNLDAHVSIDSVKDFRELTEIKIQVARVGPVHDRRRGAEEFRPGHGHLRRGPGPRSRYAQVRRADHGGRCPGRRLLQLDAEGSLLLGQSGYDL